MGAIIKRCDKISLHFVEPETRMRAELASISASLGHHCEIYADLSDVAAYPPRSGIVFVRDRFDFCGVDDVLERLLCLGIWLPVVAMDTAPSPSRVVNAIKGGALDYLVLPIQPDRLARCLDRVVKEADAVSEECRRRVLAQRQLATLSAREGEVLEALAYGGSNKDIARKLQISPRTVEIHRANMMVKLGVRHASEAVRMKLEAGVPTNRTVLPQAA
jgi:FixJ family two-component response regulator